MRRKNWISKKKNLYDKILNKNIITINEQIIDRYNYIKDIHGAIRFFRKIFFMKNKIKNTNVKSNLFFLFYMLKSYRNFSKKKFYRIFYKVKSGDLLLLSPTYTFCSQYFEYKCLFNTVLKKYKVKGFFIYKNFFRHSGYKINVDSYKKDYIGYNFYVIKANKIIFEKLFNFFSDKEFRTSALVKHYDNYYTNKILNKNEIFNILNLYWNFNLNLINYVEFYKIIVYIYINNLHKN